MIEFPEAYSEPKLLRKAVRWALKNRDYIPSLSQLSPKKDTESLVALGKEWQAAGLGILMESSEDGVLSVFFSLNNKAVSVVQKREAKSLWGWIRSFSRSDWIAIAAVVVSVVALFRSS